MDARSDTDEATRQTEMKYRYMLKIPTDVSGSAERAGSVWKGFNKHFENHKIKCAIWGSVFTAEKYNHVHQILSPTCTGENTT